MGAASFYSLKTAISKRDVRVAVDEGRLEVGLRWEAVSVLFSTKTAFSKRDVITYS